MFNLQIKGVSVVFSKFFAASDAATVKGSIPADCRRVVFLDTAPTAVLVQLLEELHGEGKVVVLRDHHDVTEADLAKGGRAAEIRAAADRQRAIFADGRGGAAWVSTRAEHPACSSLVEEGEFAGPATIVVADSDLDGLTAAMKGLGVMYPGLDTDAAVFDGPRTGQSAETLTALGWTMARAMSTLPPFDPARAQASEDAKCGLFGEFVAAASGDEQARKSLEGKVAAYEAAVEVAKQLAATATEVAPGVHLVDVRGKRPDLATLGSLVESRPGAVITVQLKELGPIAAKCGGEQFSLAVKKDRQKEVDLRQFLPEGAVSSPETGWISNTSFLLHCSKENWERSLLPALKARFAPSAEQEAE